MEHGTLYYIQVLFLLIGYKSFNGIVKHDGHDDTGPLQSGNYPRYAGAINKKESDMKFSSEARPELLRLWLTSHLSQLHRSSRQVHTVLLPVPAIQLSASFDQHDL